jgi:hypothetical protein
VIDLIALTFKAAVQQPCKKDVSAAPGGHKRSSTKYSSMSGCALERSVEKYTNNYWFGTVLKAIFIFDARSHGHLDKLAVLTMKHVPTIILIAGTFSTTVANGQNSAVEKYVASIQSVEQVKESLRSALTANCATGSCVNNNATEICSLTGALDLRLDNLISNFDTKYVSQPKIPISVTDLQLFKRIWKQCRPTTYQYWNYGTVLHVAYEFDSREDAEIRRSLGLKLEQKLPTEQPAAIRSSPTVALLAPLEPNAVVSEENRNNISLFNDLVRMVRASGYRCDSISSMRPFLTSRGFKLLCNRFDYVYEIEDKGGRWQVIVK